MSEQDSVQPEDQLFGADVSDEWLEATASAYQLGGVYTEFAYCTQAVCPG